MGIPYSKEINSALSQVQPLVKEGFIVLEKTKNISLILLVLQLFTLLILSLIALLGFGILLSVNPDLSHERKLLVTPVVKWFAGWVLKRVD
jgi:hypothetical protein